MYYLLKSRLTFCLVMACPKRTLAATHGSILFLKQFCFVKIEFLLALGYYYLIGLEQYMHFHREGASNPILGWPARQISSICQEDKSMTPGGGLKDWGALLSSVPPTPLSCSLTLKGLFESTQSYLSLASCFASGTTKLQGHCHAFYI